MKRVQLILSGLFLSLTLLSCSSQASDVVSHTGDGASTIMTNSTANSDISSNPESSQDSTSTSPSSEEIQTSESVSENPLLAEEEVSYLSSSTLYGITNGNALNGGLAVYDKSRTCHYYAKGNAIYQFNPHTDLTEILHASLAQSSITNLALVSNSLYFVAGLNRYSYKLDLTSKVVTDVGAYETYYISRYSNYMYLGIKKLDYSENLVTGLGIYRHDTSEWYQQFAASVTNVQISGTRLLYTVNNSAKIELMASTFSGKTTLKDFSSLNFISIEKSILVSEEQTGTSPRVFALLMRNTTETNLYIYQTEDDSLTKIDEGDEIDGLNTNGRDIFYINNSTLMAYNLADKVVRSVVSLEENDCYISIINHWVYVGSAQYTSLKRLHPDTQLLVTL